MSDTGPVRAWFVWPMRDFAYVVFAASRGEAQEATHKAEKELGNDAAFDPNIRCARAPQYDSWAGKVERGKAMDRWQFEPPPEKPSSGALPYKCVGCGQTVVTESLRSSTGDDVRLGNPRWARERLRAGGPLLPKGPYCGGCRP